MPKEIPVPRYLVIRMRIGREAVGILKLPMKAFVGCVTPDNEHTYVDEISEAEYETYRELGLFPGYNYHQEEPGGSVSVYNPKIYKVKGHKIVKRGKRDEREKRKLKKKGWL